MIYMTPFDPATKEPIALSENSGFDTLGAVVAMMGQPKQQTPSWALYDGLIFSFFPVWLGPCKCS